MSRGIYCSKCKGFKNEKHPYCTPCQTKYKKEWKNRNLAKVKFFARRRHFKEKFNITVFDYYSMMAEQGNICAICKNPEKTKYKGKLRRLSVDHNHKTGHIRALLCHACNSNAFKDESFYLRRKADYLNFHDEVHEKTDWFFGFRLGK